MAFTGDSEQRENGDEQEENFHGVLPTGQVWKCNFNLPGSKPSGCPAVCLRLTSPTRFRSPG
jgi:hypothetical protein